MSKLNIEGLTDKTPEVVKLRTALEKATGQQVAIVNVEKSSRKSGVSVRPVAFVLGDESQIVTFLVRQGGDIYRVQINGKDFPLTGDITLSSETYQKKSFNLAISQIADAVRNGAAAFRKKQQAIKIPPATKKDKNGRVTPKNTTQMLKQIVAEEAELDAVINTKTDQRDNLKIQLDQKIAAMV